MNIAVFFVHFVCWHFTFYFYGEVVVIIVLAYGLRCSW